ncbi:hypothetical protein IMX26_02485 [Clostridium sp. 'deep sea']|uniref:hypothetical protein n=1 Tax=Clostridium sp. 'deep sea' TaxID=2779445 RepID=UPI0018965952|nr:hypothetical protein [Clostridium sp. 'deep sea']QOR35720.1 hypothetical protein IMX26_02485 [Clostridium sp. 'deep sea']
MSKNSDFDNGFDRGFNVGYDLGYERGLFECEKLQKDNLSTLLFNSQLSKELFSNLILTINKQHFIELFNKFTKDISIIPLNYKAIFNRIVESFNAKKTFSILSTNDFFSDINRNNDYKGMISTLRKTDVILMPSLIQSDLMFSLNSFLYNNNIFTDIGLQTVPKNLINSKFIWRLNDLSEFYIYDENASHIISYFTENRVICRNAKNHDCQNKICLLGIIPHKWSTLETLQQSNNIVIDIQEIRTQLVNKILPIGLN